MAITPTGILQHSYYLMKMVAASESFQSVVGASSATLAEESIVYPAATDDEDEGTAPKWPRAVISETSEFSATKMGTACWQYNGGLSVAFEFVVPLSVYQESFTESFNYFQNDVGGVIADMIALSGTGEPVTGTTHLNVTEITLMDGPWFMPVSETAGGELPEVATPLAAWWAVYQVGFF